MAIDATHRLAISGVKFTQILVKKISIHNTHTTICTINSAALFQAGFPCNAFSNIYPNNFTRILATQ